MKGEIMNVLNKVKTVALLTKTFALTHKGTILTVVGVGCIAAGTYTAIKQAPKAKEAIEIAEDIRNKEGEAKGIGPDDPAYHLSYVERVKIGVRYLWLPSVLTVSGTGALLINNHISLKDAAKAGADALAYKQAYNDLARLHNDYIYATNKVTTEDQQKEIRQEVAAQQVPNRTPEVIAVKTGKGESLYLDELTGQYFRSSDSAIANAAISFARDMHEFRLANPDSTNGWGTVNEWLGSYLMINELGSLGDDNGWCAYGANNFRIHISEDYETAPNGEPCKTLSYDWSPTLI